MELSESGGGVGQGGAGRGTPAPVELCQVSHLTMWTRECSRRSGTTAMGAASEVSLSVKATHSLEHSSWPQSTPFPSLWLLLLICLRVGVQSA